MSFYFWHLISFLIITSEKEFKVKLIFPVTSLTWRETSNTFCLMEWHKASLWAGPDGFDRDHRARKLVLSGRRLTRSPPLFQCVAWQPAFCWWGSNKAWHGVTPVHACWQPPTPPPPLTTPHHHLPAWTISRLPSSQRPIRLSTLGQTLTLIMAGHCSCQMGLMTQSIWSNTGAAEVC